MKKITSLFCALAIVLSASAAPQLRAPKIKSDKQQLEQRLAKAGSDKERDELIHKYKTAMKAKGLQPSKAKSATAKAPKATKEADQVTIVRVSSTIYADDGTIFYGLHTADWSPAFYFDIPLAEGARDVELGKTYTLDEMNASSCEWDDEDWNEHYYTAATFKKTIGDNYDVHISATITDEDGKEWVLAYDEAPVIPTGETIQVNITKPMSEPEYIASDGSWLLRARDNSSFAQLEYYSNDSESPAGTFSGQDIDLNDTYVEFPDGEDEWGDPEYKSVFAKDGSITVTVGDDRIDATASILGADGNVYAITMFFALPKAESQEDFVSNNLQVDDWAFEFWGEVQIFASTEDGKSIGLDLYPGGETFLGTHEIGGSNGGYISVDGEQFNLYSGSVTIGTRPADGMYVVTGKVLAWNNVEYTLTLNEPEVVVTSRTFESNDLILDIYEGAFQIAGFDEDHEDFLSLGIYSNEVAGTYSAEDFAPEATYLAVGEDIYVFAGEADIEVTANDENEVVIGGTIRLVNQDDRFDVVELTVTAGAHPYVPSERDVTIGAFAFRYYDDGPDVFYMLVSEDQLQGFKFDILVDKWSADVEFGKTYTLDDMIQDQNTQGVDVYENAYINYTSVSFIKTKTDAGVKIVATIGDTRGNTWNLVYEGEDYDAEVSFSVELGQANGGTHPDGGVEYEMVDVDNTLKCVLVFPNVVGDDVEYDETYTSEDGGIDLEISYLSILGEEHAITSAEFEKEDYYWATAYYYTVNVVDDRGYTFNLRYYEDAFQLTGDTVELSFAAPIEVSYDEDWDEWTIKAEGDTITVSFLLDGDEELLSEEDLASSVEYGWSTYIEIFDTLDEEGLPVWFNVEIREVKSLVLTGEEDHYTLNADVVGKDGVVYIISVTQATEAIDNVQGDNVQCTKVLRNGQLIIEKNGVKYNILGAVVK